MKNNKIIKLSVAVIVLVVGLIVAIKVFNMQSRNSNLNQNVVVDLVEESVGKNNENNKDGENNEDNNGDNGLAEIKVTTSEIFDKSYKEQSKALRVKNEEEIYDKLYNSIKVKNKLLNFDVSEFKNKNVKFDELIINDWYDINYKNPHLDYVEDVKINYNKNSNIVRVKIVYRYYIDNSDIYIYEDEKESNIVMGLDRRIIKNGDISNISLKGVDLSKYSVKYSSDNSSIIKVDNKGVITALKEGSANVYVDINNKNSGQKLCLGNFNIIIIPSNAIEINNMHDITKAIGENMGKDVLPIFIKTKDLNFIDAKQGILQAENGYRTANFDLSYTHLNYIYTQELSKQECLEKLKQIDKKADEIIKNIIKPDMTDLKKEKAIHDYVVDNAEYDYENYYIKGSVPMESRTPYGILFKNTGICGGYALTMKLLLNKADIECYLIVGQGNGEEHMWNIVKIDGKYYHLDATFDDPVPNEKGKVVYDYFNVDDEKISMDHTWIREEYLECKN